MTGLSFYSPKAVTLDTVLSFGQYKGDTVEVVMQHDARYLLWANDNVDFFNIDDVLLLDELERLADSQSGDYVDGYDYYYDLDDDDIPY